MAMGRSSPLLGGIGIIVASLTGLGMVVILATALRDTVGRWLIILTMLYWIALIGYSLVSVPIAINRTMLPGMIPLLIAMGMGQIRFPHKFRLFPMGALLSYAVLVSGYGAFSLANHAREDVRGFCQKLDSHLHASDLLVAERSLQIMFHEYGVSHPEANTTWIESDETPAAVIQRLRTSDHHPAENRRRVILVYRDSLGPRRDQGYFAEIAEHLAADSGIPSVSWQIDYYYCLSFGLPETSKQ